MSSCSKSEDVTNASGINSENRANLKSLPLISINTKGNTIVDEPKVSADMQIFEGDSLIESHQIGIEIR